MNLFQYESIHGKNWSARLRNQGVALVVVLSCLLLVCGLVLSFFLSVSTETKASKLSESIGRSRDLTDTAVNLVMAQIREATTQGGFTAWASQPGMIRTYGSPTGAGSSAPLTYYKLYSSAQMVESPGAFNPALDVPDTWFTTPSLYTDLNQPVLDLEGQRQYPVIDPAAGAAAGSVPAVTGFEIEDAPVSVAGDNSLPMPARWLYVLQDGTLTVPASGTDKVASWGTSGAGVPTQDNPIVGRIAFWTDDESSKLNVNTAAGDEWLETQSGSSPIPGSYWDVPRINTTFDKERLAVRQIGQHEFQRYPGHPATTYLSAVFPNLTRDGIGNIVSRIQRGGSLGGTAIASEKVQTDSDRLYASVDELIFAPDRTLQDADGVTRQELDRSRFFLTANSRSPEVNLFNRPRISIWPLHVNNSTAYRTAFDRLINFCSSINGHAYSFQRENAYSPTSDFATIARNQDLYSYLQQMTRLPVPGFGGAFTTKYPEDRDQILTEIFDYIRSTNLFDDTLEPQDQDDPGSWSFPTQGNQFTSARTRNSSNNRMGGLPGHGQVAPIRIDANDTMGFGRFNTISEVGLHFICTADGSGDENMPPGDPLSTTASEENESRLRNDAKLASNNIDAQPETDTPHARPAYKKNRTLEAKLSTTQIRLEAMFLMELFCAAQGWNAINEEFMIRVVGLDNLVLKGALDGSFQPLGFPDDAIIYLDQQPFAHTRTIGGSNGFRVTLANRGAPKRGILQPDNNGGNIKNTYPFLSAPITIQPGGTGEPIAPGSMSVDYQGSEPIRIEIYCGKLPSMPSAQSSFEPDPSMLVQTIHVNFTPDGPETFPAPRLVYRAFAEYLNSSSTSAEFTPTLENFWTFSRTSALVGGGSGRLAYITRPPKRWTRSPVSGWKADPECIGGLFRKEDVLRTLVPSHGDYRHVAARREVDDTVFEPHQFYRDESRNFAHSFTEGYQGHSLLLNSTSAGKLAPLQSGQNYHGAYAPDVPYRDGLPWGADSGDWDHGTGITPDGAYINKPDEGHNAPGVVPYFANDWDHEASGPTFFSPNRQVTSAVMFGSLPTQIKSSKSVEDRAWRTLLFRPSPLDGHVGAQSPPDHLLLDLFWMPVVEPYAISEPFSTAGKINMNYQIVPFTYIKRDTGLRALLQSERVAAVPLTAASSYKSGTSTNYRYLIDADKTLQQFENRFDNGDIFRSASEICDIYLIPKGAPGSEALDAAAMPLFWEAHALTGDNLRERPYATLYPRLTTKSNTYTIHYKVQVLQQASRSRGSSATAWATWDGTKDQVQSELRGSSTIERYVDALDPALPDYAQLPAESEETLDSRYRFRVLNTRRFAP